MFNPSPLRTKYLKFIAMSIPFANNYRPKLEAISADPRMNGMQFTVHFGMIKKTNRFTAPNVSYDSRSLEEIAPRKLLRRERQILDRDRTHFCITVNVLAS